MAPSAGESLEAAGSWSGEGDPGRSTCVQRPGGVDQLAGLFGKKVEGEDQRKAGFGWNKWALNAKPRSVSFISPLGSGGLVSQSFFLPRFHVP